MGNWNVSPATGGGVAEDQVILRNGLQDFTAPFDAGAQPVTNLSEIGVGVTTALAGVHVRNASAIQFDNGASDGFAIAQAAANTWTWTALTAGSIMALQNSDLIIGSTSSAGDALLQLDSTTKGFLPPRMTAANLAAISSPVAGMLAYQSDGTPGLYLYSAAAWAQIGAASGDLKADGSVPMTSGWAFGSQTLYNVSKLGVGGAVDATSLAYLKGGALASAAASAAGDLLRMETATGVGTYIHLVGDDEQGLVYSDTVRARGYALYNQSTDTMYWGTAGTMRMKLWDDGFVTLGQTPNTNLGGRLQIDDATNNIELRNSISNNSDKVGRMTLTHYANTEEPVTLVYGAISNTTSSANLGWGSAGLNAARTCSLWASTNTTTVTGTELLRAAQTGVHIDQNGVISDAAIGSLHVTQGSATGGQACLGLQQKDVSEPFTRYVGDSHAADASLSLVDAAALTTPSARFAYIKVYIQDDANNITDQVGYIGVELAPTA